MLYSFSKENINHFNTEANTKATQQSFSIDQRIITTYGSQIGPYGISVYNVLCCFANESEFCSLSVGQIAKTIGASNATVRKTFRVLQTHGLIDVVPNYNQDGGQRSNQYRMLSIDIHQKKQNSRAKESTCCP